MGRPRKLTHTMPTEIKDAVTVAFVEDMELAEQYRFLLLENAIPAVIQQVESAANKNFSNIALQVPEEFVDQAYTMLTQNAVCDDFFSMVFGSETGLMNMDRNSEEDE